MRTLLLGLVLAAVTFASRSARAQAQLLPDKLAGAGEEDVEAWNPSLAATATVSLVGNANVVGQVDGLSTLFGLGLVGGLDYVRERHVLRNTLSISESFARTPVIDELVKTNDVVKLEGLYNYFVTKHLGGFGRLAIETALFPADDVRGEPTSWVLKPRNPGDPTVPLEQSSFRQRLADPLSPLTISESAGVFFQALDSEKLSLTLRGGVGGRHTFASDVKVIDDDGATPEVELLELANVHQLGLEAFAGAGGTLRGGKLSYKAGVSLLVPAVNNDDADRSVTDLTRIGLESSVTFNVFEWMSLVYTLNVTRDPQLFPAGDEKTQVQTSVLLTFQYAFVEKRKKAKQPTAAELALAAEKKRADDAEAARAAAEQKVVELEQKVRDTEAACQTRCEPAAAPAPPAPPAPAIPVAPTSPDSVR
jgi:hypothetical protein